MVTSSKSGSATVLGQLLPHKIDRLLSNVVVVLHSTRSAFNVGETADFGSDLGDNNGGLV
jgi:hypothetical protein